MTDIWQGKEEERVRRVRVPAVAPVYTETPKRIEAPVPERERETVEVGS